MKTFLINVFVFVALTFAIDAFWFEGRYYGFVWKAAHELLPRWF
jgi:hypothetical protein